MKGTVVFAEKRGASARVGARTEDGLMWFWTTTGPAPIRGQVVEIPMGARPEPARRNAAGPGKAQPGNGAQKASQEPKALGTGATVSEEVERMLRAVALKAAATVCSGQPNAADKVTALAEKFLAWLRG